MKAIAIPNRWTHAYKANADRRHKISKTRYRVTNWPGYDAALIRRGSLTLRVTEEALAAWHAPVTGKRGGQAVYADVAIETVLALRLVFHQPLQQTEGAMRSIVVCLASASRSRTIRRPAGAVAG